MNSFAITYTDKNRKRLLKEYENVEAFIDKYEAQAIIPELKEYALEENDEMEWDEDQYNTSRSMINGRLKALIARNLWNTSAYYQVFNREWPTYKKALSILREDDYSKYNLARSEF